MPHIGRYSQAAERFCCADGFGIIFLTRQGIFHHYQSRKPSRSSPGFPVNAHRHTRRPAGGHAEAAAASAALKRAYNVDARLAVDTEVVDRPFCVVDGFYCSATAASGLCGRLRSRLTAADPPAAG